MSDRLRLFSLLFTIEWWLNYYMAVIISDTKKIGRCAALLMASIVFLSTPLFLDVSVARGKPFFVRRLAGVLESIHIIMRIIYFVLAARPNPKRIV